MDYKTIKGVPIVSTGTYPLGSGQTTFTADDLASAVLAASDPTVSKPRIKIGHLDKRFESDPALDGNPAMGTVGNMALSEDGQTIIGDLENVPAWLADSMHSAYPGRSIEGGFGYTAPSGHDYKLVISNLALLGETLPGVGSLPDLAEVLKHNGTALPAAVAASDGSDMKLAGGTVRRFVTAAISKAFTAAEEGEIKKLLEGGMSRVDAEAKVREKSAQALKIKGAIDLGALPRRFASDLVAGRVPKIGDADQSKWWPRSVQAEDDGSLAILVDADEQLLTLPITVTDGDVAYGTPVAVAASTGALSVDNLKGPRVLASWPSSAPRPNTEAKSMKINDVEVDQAVLAKRLGLAEDADEATIMAALGEKTETTATTPAASTETTETVKLPDGVVAIDAQKLAELERGAAAGSQVAASLAQSERDQAILAAIKGGRIVASARKTWTERWDKAPEETRTLLTASQDKGGLAAVIPVDQIEAGHAGTGESTSSAPEARLFPELATEVAA